MTDRADDILTFWLDEVGPAGWYTSDPAVDARMTQEFLPDWERARAGGYRPWLTRPRPALALLLLLDQFSRNIFRGEARAFSADAQALSHAGTAIRLGHDRRIPEPARQFFYLPFMHSERLADQDRCLRLILLGLPEHGKPNLDAGILHRDVIRRFGRFPSRNAALGRADTAAEIAYRAQGGYMA